MALSRLAVLDAGWIELQILVSFKVETANKERKRKVKAEGGWGGKASRTERNKRGEQRMLFGWGRK